MKSYERRGLSVDEFMQIDAIAMELLAQLPAPLEAKVAVVDAMIARVNLYVVMERGEKTQANAAGAESSSVVPITLRR
jgi:hypothetical protein